MIRFVVVVREPGALGPDYSLEFEAPALPREGDYLSVQRPDHERPFGEDMIVAKVWWRLSYPGTEPVVFDSGEVGSLDEIFVECIPAVGPYSTDRWRDSLERLGAPRLEVSRIAYRESEIAAAREAVGEVLRGRAAAAARVGPDGHDQEVPGAGTVPAPPSGLTSAAGRLED
jgi:hypothetical protein